MTRKVSEFMLRALRAISCRKISCSSALDVAGLPTVQADKGLLAGNGPLQHGFHHRAVAAVLDAADIEGPVAGRNVGIDPDRVVLDDAFFRRFGPAAETAHTVGDLQRRQIDQFRGAGVFRSISDLWLPSRLHNLLICRFL